MSTITCKTFCIPVVLVIALAAGDARGDFLILKNGKSFRGKIETLSDGSFATSETKFRYGQKLIARVSREKTVQEAIEKWSDELGKGRTPVIREGYLSLAKFCMHKGRYKEAEGFFERTGQTSKWKVYTSKFYFILSDTKMKRVKEVRNRLDAIMTFYQSEFGEKRQPGRDFVVRFFKSESSYDAFSRKHGVGGAGAYYSPGSGELVLWDMSLTDKKGTFEAVYHEANHQFVGAYYLDYQPKHAWFSEGLATYYESAKCKGGRIVRHGKKQRFYLATLKEAIRGIGLTPWSIFLTMERDRFYCGGNRGSINYAQAWGFVYFLKNTKDPKCRRFFERYIAVLREEKDDAAALAAAYEEASLEDIEKAFDAFERRF